MILKISQIGIVGNKCFKISVCCVENFTVIFIIEIHVLISKNHT